MKVIGVLLAHYKLRVRYILILPISDTLQLIDFTKTSYYTSFSFNRSKYHLSPTLYLGSILGDNYSLVQIKATLTIISS